MVPSETMAEALKRELSTVGVSCKTLAATFGVSPSYLSMVVHGEKLGNELLHTLGVWLLSQKLDARYIMALWIYERAKWLRTPEARWRSANYTAKLWVEEQESKMETKNAVYD